MNGKVEVRWRILRTITHSLMVYAKILEAYIHFALMYTAYHIFRLIPIKYMTPRDSDPTTPFELVIGTKVSISNLRVLFCPCVVRKATAHVDKKALNMRHQAQNVFVVSLLELHIIKKSILFT